jgi:hypothetical protein
MGLAMGVPPAKPLEGCGYGKGGPSPLGSKPGPKGREASRWTRRRQQTGRLAHFSPFVCDPSARAWARYPNHPGLNGTFGSEYHNDLYARAQARSDGCDQLSGPVVLATTTG